MSGENPENPLARAPLLVLGWGNLSRGDDALGPLFVAALREQLPSALRSQVEFLEDYQLQVEHALDLVGRERLLLVDASLTCSAPFEARRIHAERDASYSSHALSAQALLQVFADMQGCAAPPTTLLAIRGEAFGLGTEMSEAARVHLRAAVDWGVEWFGWGGELNTLQKSQRSTWHRGAKCCNVRTDP